MSRTAGRSILKIAPPYDERLVAQIARGFSERLGFDVQFDVTEDPALRCGFVAYVHGTVYDMSGSTQIESLRAHLLDSMFATAEEGGES